MKPGYICESREVSFKTLCDFAPQARTIYVGATVDHLSRKYQHQRDGYTGGMYLAKTDNQVRDEDKLLELSHCPKDDRFGGTPQSPGYVYVIQGRRWGEENKKLTT